MIMPSQEQSQVIKDAVNWYYNSSDLFFQISGGPGTGKSYLLHEIVKALNISPDKVAPMAYTGAAAIVMRRKGFPNSKTIHSWLLEPVECIKKSNGQYQYNEYFNIPEVGVEFIPKPLYGIDLIVIDEGFMVPDYIKDMLIKRNIKTIVAGDIDQLPPVKYRPAFFLTGEIHFLNEIFRQKAGSGIVYLSNRLKEDKPIHLGTYGDCTVIYDEDVTPDMIMASDIIICAKNDTRQGLTNLVRHDIFKYGDGLPLHGERLVCRNNNWKLEVDGINLANGLIGNVYNYPDVTGMDKGFFTIDFLPMYGNTPFKKVDVDYKYFNALFKDKITIKQSKWTRGDKLEYAYAITTHISQGSEFNNGIYYQEYLNKDINRNLWYVGITRFQEHCFFVKHRRRYY